MSILLSTEARAENYNPLSVDPAFHAAHKDIIVHDDARNRDIPLRVFLPAQTAPATVVLFSPGLGGSRAGSAYLGEHWAARGYVAVFLQHPGSDDAVWKNAPVGGVSRAMNQAASPENFLLRVADVPAVLDQLQKWNTDKTNFLFGRLDGKKAGMSGHSFGAVTTEAVSGETMPMNGQEFTDARIGAAIAMSPSPAKHLTQEEAFGAVKVPWLLITGTKDVSPIGGTTAEDRLKVYPALHGAPKFELVLFNAEHSAFIERALLGDRQPRNPNHHRAVLALSTAFWDAYLHGDAGALAWLKGPGPRTILEKDDTWQFSAP
jgi:predicted dienelactone hydrolase